MPKHAERRKRSRPIRSIAGGAMLALIAGLLAAPGASPASAATEEATESFETAPDAMTAPDGWQIERERTAGMREGWEGWTFHTLGEVTSEFGTGGDRPSFIRAEGTFAVVHSDSNRPANGAYFDSTLWAPEYELSDTAEAVRVAFDSHYKQGQNPSGRLVASFDEAEPVLIEEFSSHRLNEAADFSVDVPANAESVRIGWEYLESSNNWYWMIDNVSISEAELADIAPRIESSAKPAVFPGASTTVRLSGLRDGQQVVAELGEAESARPVTGIPAAGAAGNVAFGVTVPEEQDPGTLVLRIAGEGVVPFEIPITVMSAPADDADRTTTEPQLWFDGFEAPAEGAVESTAEGSAELWTQSGSTEWEFSTRSEIVDTYGLDRRQAFTRASGIIAVADAKDAAFVGALTSELIAVDAGSELELRFDSHYRARGGADSGVVSVSFDGGRQEELYRLGDTDEESAQPRLAVSVPSDAESAQFSFEFGAPAGGGSWMIDDVQLVEPLGALTDGTDALALVDVFSDVQGATSRLQNNVMPGLRGLEPQAHTILSNGDQTGNGTPSQYDDYFAAFNAGGGDEYETRISTIGNHEFYGSNGVDTYIERFLDRTEMSQYGTAGSDSLNSGLWGEVMVDGELPLMWIGSEQYDYSQKTGGGPFVEVSDEQFNWLRDRLNHWQAEGKPVLLASHHVFANSVSGTYINFTANDFGDDTERIEALLANYSNVTILTSHTHWSAGLNDWSVEQRFDPATKLTPTIVNTAAVTSVYGPSGDWGETAIGGADPVGLRVALYEDRLRVTAYAFGAGGATTELKHIDVALPADSAETPGGDDTGNEGGDEETGGDEAGGDETAGNENAAGSDRGVADSGDTADSTEALAVTGTQVAWLVTLLAVLLAALGAGVLIKSRRSQSVLVSEEATH